MAMRNISKNYKIKADGTGLVESGEVSEGSREIKIILTQLAVNEN